MSSVMIKRVRKYTAELLSLVDNLREAFTLW
jgi:hypothetical protein